MYLIRAGAIENIEWLIRKNGQNPAKILAALGLSSALLREPETLVSYPKIADLLELCAEVCNDPGFGFHLAQSQSHLALGEYAALINQQHSFEEALRFSQQYLYLHARGMHIEMVPDSGVMQLHFGFDFTNSAQLQQLVQLSIGQFLQYIKLLMPGKYQQFTIHMQQALAENVKAVLGDYQFMLSDRHTFNGVSFPLRWLSTQLTPSETMTQSWSTQRIQALNAFYPDDLSAQVRYLCSNLLVTGDCTIEVVAQALDMQPRTLQRKLKHRGVRFRDLLTRVRLVRAKQYLQNSSMTITDIALNLGYAETAVFTRNFKQWTGKSPLQWRKDPHASE